MTANSTAGRWSSSLAFYLATIGAAVGLGSIWRFPYLVGANGGSAFVVVFVIACLVIATPLLVAEFIIGRRARVSPPAAAGVLAASFGRSTKWNIIGIFGSVAAFLIMSYYTIIAGWVLAYTWKCASGQLVGLSPGQTVTLFKDFLAHPLQVSAWHIAFLALAGTISGRGLHRGIEVANKIRAPGLLVLLLILVAYALLHGEVRQGLTFAFVPDFGKISAQVVLVAIGQAFYATGVGMGMMLAYGAYVPKGASLMRSALGISGSIVLVSLLATLLVFPLLYKYGLDPAQGPDLVFKVLPAIFAEMPAGRLVGTLFFILLILAALTPTIAGLEPLVAWVEQRGLTRPAAVTLVVAAGWVIGLGSVLSFNLWAHWFPLDWIPRFRGMTFFDVVDFVTSNAMLPIGALLTCALIGWLLPRRLTDDELQDEGVAVRRFVAVLLRWLCPAAIAAVLVLALI